MSKIVKEKSDKSPSQPTFSLDATEIEGLDAHARTMVIFPYVRGQYSGSIEARLSEAEALAHAIDLNVIDSEAIGLAKLRAATYLGTGKVDDLKAKIEQQEIDLLVVDCALSPVQQRNLERELKVKVIDRTGLILEIFGARAQTREGVLQVALAHFDYQKSRLVRSWTHLERQRGGGGFMGGPGERQIESDRRALKERISQIKQQLNKVGKTRTLHRDSRAKIPFPVVALVGYTNAGKSTLFNLLTDAKVSARDRLFETLDPTMRSIDLPNGQKIILSDTVGFISHLPHELVAAFRATLEEVLAADLIVHVRDIHSSENEAQKQDVFEVLEKLGLDQSKTPIIECLNKMDLLDAESFEKYKNISERSDDIVSISAVTGEGIEPLLQAITNFVNKGDVVQDYSLAYSEGKALSWIYAHGEVLKREEKKGAVKIKARLSNSDYERFKHMFGHVILAP